MNVCLALSHGYYQYIWELSFTFSMIKVASAHLDLISVLTSYTSIHMLQYTCLCAGSYKWNFCNCVFIIPVSHPAFHSLTVFKLLTLCITVFVCYSGLYLYALKLLQEEYLPGCVIICADSIYQSYLQLYKACQSSVFWKLSFCLTVYWIYAEV